MRELPCAGTSRESLRYRRQSRSSARVAPTKDERRPMWIKLPVTLLVAGVLSASAINVSAAPRIWGAIQVSMLDAPESVLIGKWVFDRQGRPIGRVRSIDVGREGKAEVVNIEVGAVRSRGTEIVAV